MKLKLETGHAFCWVDGKINGREIDHRDFVTQKDVNPERRSNEWCCGNMKGFPKEPNQAICDHYAISLEEFRQVAEDIAERVSFGKCCWCE